MLRRGHSMDEEAHEQEQRLWKVRELALVDRSRVFVCCLTLGHGPKYVAGKAWISVGCIHHPERWWVGSSHPPREIRSRPSRLAELVDPVLLRPPRWMRKMKWAGLCRSTQLLVHVVRLSWLGPQRGGRWTGKPPPKACGHSVALGSEPAGLLER